MRNRQQWLAVALLCIAAIAAIAATAAAPATAPTTAPADPAAVIHTFLSALQRHDVKQARDCWFAANPQEAQAIDLSLKVRLAIARLKRAVRDRMGLGAVLDLNFAVCTDFECGPINVHITDDTATAEVHSIDPQSNITQAPGKFSLVRVHGQWKLSIADDIKSTPPPPNAAQADAMINTIADGYNAAADAVAAGRLKTVDDVQRQVDGLMGE